MQETQVPSLGWEDLLDKEMAPAPVFLLEKSPVRRSRVGHSSQGRKESDRTEHVSPLAALAEMPSL